MLLIISLMTFFIVMLFVIVACETYAMTYPKDNFSQWWRKYIIQDDTNFKND